MDLKAKSSDIYAKIAAAVICGVTAADAIRKCERKPLRYIWKA